MLSVELLLWKMTDRSIGRGATDQWVNGVDRNHIW
jgi:hypothetical protein